jgi:hypothetical protein
MNVDGRSPTNHWQEHTAPQGENVTQHAAVEADQFVAGVIQQAVVNVGNQVTQEVGAVTDNVAQNVGTSSTPLIPVPNFVQIAVASAPKLKSVIVRPSSASDPLVTVVPSLLKKVLNFIPFSPSPNFLRRLNL